ncbi:enoyl-CoA hydratase/isomerase family protein [Azospirillum sp. RWY-5-1]|uniref:Enoyl-CoA hydratase/isomerase family protein n=1 Tax=Azospirillum oleiclasticum TaxID=2735135 RepID=A0ABX2TMD3_9PROT|nr:enoyl-CoA hydratase-related protein [Azospirillum oleiclasticum]NYZ16555.1 enoyl-CoA hydratase/isomerase family protein [Azospirillum oleiclasticum]NYZ23975.1 enoyl-CoA hydratase/isomerase family protein [Azospirillum oleiclasticum]
MTAASPSVTVDLAEGVAVVALNEPETRNALTPSLRDALMDALSELVASADCRIIVLTGTGAAFCAGGDLNSLPDHDPLAIRRRLARSHELLRLIVAGPKPVIAAVNGAAFGAGLSLAAACDVVLASPAARFGAVFGKVGLMGDMGLLWSLPQRIGTAATRRLLFTSAIIDAEAALGLGLVDRCVRDDALLEEARALAGELAEAPPVAVAATKAVLARGPAPLDQILAAELDHQTLLFSTDDFVEGRAAFKERRRARFTGH